MILVARVWVISLMIRLLLHTDLLMIVLTMVVSVVVLVELKVHIHSVMPISTVD